MYVLLVSALILILPSLSSADFKWNPLAVFSRRGKNEDRTLLPKLLPNEDSEFLIAYSSDNCDNCEQMEPVVQRLEDDLNTKVRRINISRRKEFIAALEVIGFDECGTLPFYYNRRTGQAICGATTYLNLKKLGCGSLRHLFQDAPDSLIAGESDVAAQRDVGTKGYLLEKINNLASKGKGKAEKETKRVASKAEKKVQEKMLSAAERTAARKAARAQKQPNENLTK